MPRPRLPQTPLRPRLMTTTSTRPLVLSRPTAGWPMSRTPTTRRRRLPLLTQVTMRTILVKQAARHPRGWPTRRHRRSHHLTMLPRSRPRAHRNGDPQEPMLSLAILSHIAPASPRPIPRPTEDSSSLRTSKPSTSALGHRLKLEHRRAHIANMRSNLSSSSRGRGSSRLNHLISSTSSRAMATIPTSSTTALPHNSSRSSSSSSSRAGTGLMQPTVPTRLTTRRRQAATTTTHSPCGFPHPPQHRRQRHLQPTPPPVDEPLWPHVHRRHGWRAGAL